jgi:tetratricopeptide (TPR) repeat protein
MAGKIFINYRQDDSPGTAGRLHDRLAQTFGRKNLFMDVDHIPAGVDFGDYLNKQVAACDVFLVVIGPNWLNAKDDRGRRRFDNPDDFVTIEIAAALARNIRVIPVLVDGARTLKADKLPDSVKPLVRRNAVEVRNTQFGRDAEALANKVREALEVARPVTGRWPFLASGAAWLMVPGGWRTVAGTAMALLLVGWIGLYTVGVPVWVPWAEQPDSPRSDKAKAAAEFEAQRKAEEAEQQRLAAAKAEDEREAKAAADAEAKRKAEEAEQQRITAAKAEEERRKQAEAEAPARYSALMSQARTELDNGDNDKVIAIANEAIRLDPNSAMAFVNRGAAYQNKGDNDRAIADYSEAIRLDPKTAVAFRNRCGTYLSKGDMDRAIANCNEAIQLNPNNAAAFVNRGAVYGNKGDNDRAIADYNEAIRLDPNSAAAFVSRGAAYQNKGDNRRAIADYSEAIRLNPNDALAFCNRGKAKLKINQASGNEDITKARQLDASICR